MKTFCPECNRKVEYKIRKNIIQEYKGIKVNVVEKIAVCIECGGDIFVENLEKHNLKRLYRKYNRLLKSKKVRY